VHFRLKKIIIKLVQILIPFYKYFFVKGNCYFYLFVVCIHISWETS